MAEIYGPILPLQLDPRNTPALVRDMQTKIFLESGEQLNDFSPASPLSAIVEGQAYAQSELLYYLNSLPEAYTLQWLRQLGIQRSIGAKAVVEVTFTKTANFNRTVVIPANTLISTANRLNFVLREEVRIGDSIQSASGMAIAQQWGSQYNVGSGAIEKINVNILGLDTVSNLVPAQGGKDLESIESMKSKAFSLMRRRGLISAEDYENEILSLAPDASIVKVLSYEERFNIDPSSPSGVIIICVGDENGLDLQQSVKQNLVKSLRKRVPLGNSISLVPPEVSPVETTVVVEYDDTEYSGGFNLYASEINNILLSDINPSSIELGGELDYQSIFNNIYNLDVVKNIRGLSMKILQRALATDVPGVSYCNFPILSESINNVCVDIPEAIIDSFDFSFENANTIRTFRTYKTIISFIASSTQAPLTYTFVNSDYDAVLRG
jgi:hypothetical protein